MWHITKKTRTWSYSCYSSSDLWWTLRSEFYLTLLAEWEYVVCSPLSVLYDTLMMMSTVVNKAKLYLLVVNGTTGESMSLTVAERKFLAEEWCKKAVGRWVITPIIFLKAFFLFLSILNAVLEEDIMTVKFLLNMCVSAELIRWLCMSVAWILKIPKIWWVVSYRCQIKVRLYKCRFIVWSSSFFPFSIDSQKEKKVTGYIFWNQMLSILGSDQNTPIWSGSHSMLVWHKQKFQERPSWLTCSVKEMSVRRFCARHGLKNTFREGFDWIYIWNPFLAH